MQSTNAKIQIKLKIKIFSAVFFLTTINFSIAYIFIIV